MTEYTLDAVDQKNQYDEQLSQTEENNNKTQEAVQANSTTTATSTQTTENKTSQAADQKEKSQDEKPKDQDKAAKTICYGTIMQMDLKKDMFLVGDLFMRKFYTVFDRENDRVGLAEAVRT